MISDDPSIIRPALHHLQSSFYSGKTLDIEYRRQQLRNLITGLKELETKFHDALFKDLGVNKVQSSLTSIGLTLTEIEECFNNVKEWTKPKPLETPIVLAPAKSYLQPEPHGVALVVGAWNYPLPTTLPYVATAIASGNCCILKPSELSPNTSNVMAELFERFLDKDCYRCIEGQVEVAKTIVKEKFDLIVFTGSTEKGKLVSKAAAENLIPCVLELGGKSPTIVNREANLENAALRIAQGRYLNCGQTCVACDYVFLHRDIKEKFVELFKQKVVEFYGSDPSKSQDYPRIVNTFHTQRLKSYLDADHGGKVLLGGEVNVEDRYVAPTLIETPKFDSKLMQEEIFGPILPIFEFDDIEQVIKFINERPKALAMYYYGSGKSSDFKMLKLRTSSGALLVNDSLMHFASAYIPFGGIGNSGQGKLHGYTGFTTFSHFKPVMECGTENAFPANARFPPYTDSKKKVLAFSSKLAHVKSSSLSNFGLWFLLIIFLIIIFKYSSFFLGLFPLVSQASHTVKETLLGSQGRDL